MYDIFVKKPRCKLCFRSLHRVRKAKSNRDICHDCFNSERSRIRSNNRHKRIKRTSKGRLRLKDWLYTLDIHDYKCVQCGKKGRHNLTIDHIVPIGIGGSNCGNNIQPLCVICHERKDGYMRKPIWVRVYRKLRHHIKRLIKLRNIKRLQ